MAAGSCLVPRPPPITFQLSSDHLTQSWDKKEGHEAEGRLGRPSAESGIFPLLQTLLRSQPGGFRSWRGSNHLLSHPTMPSLTQSTGCFRPAGDSQGWKLAVRGQTVCDVLLALFGEGQSSYGAKQNHITLGWLSARGPRFKASAFFPNTQAKHWVLQADPTACSLLPGLFSPQATHCPQPCAPLLSAGRCQEKLSTENFQPRL